jgi:hypothetical protein
VIQPEFTTPPPTNTDVTTVKRDTPNQELTTTVLLDLQLALNTLELLTVTTSTKHHQLPTHVLDVNQNTQSLLTLCHVSHTPPTKTVGNYTQEMQHAQHVGVLTTGTPPNVNWPPRSLWPD